MGRRPLPRKVTYFEPVAPRLGRNTIIESTFDVGRRFRCTMRVDCGQIDPAAVIRPAPASGGRACRTVSMRRSSRTARWAQCSLSACRADDRRASRGRRRIEARKDGRPITGGRRRFGSA
jgi:hypothetical protein